MATFKYFVSAKKRELAPIYIRLSAGKKIDLIVKTMLSVNPERWSNDTETIKQRIKTDDDNELIKKLKGLKDHVESKYKGYFGEYSKEWLTSVVVQFHTNKDINARTLNEYIESFITEAKKNNKKNKSGMNFAPGTIKAWEGFRRIFNEYQGIYTEARIEELKKARKVLRPLKKIDYEDITLSFLSDFKSFLSNEGYSTNTIWRFIKELKFFMQKSLNDKKHNNRDFQTKVSFSGTREESFSIYLTQEEIEKIYKIDLTPPAPQILLLAFPKIIDLDKIFPHLALARDAFMVLCETALRISDYPKVDINIKTKDGRRYIHLIQTKTGGEVIIPLTIRMAEILKKYDGKLPGIPEQYVNKYIKVVAELCGINEMQHWEASKFGKKFQRSALKHELITCHSGRRSACTNMYLAGLPVIDIMKISGHTSQKIFMDYIKITKEETAVRLADHPYFKGNTLKVVS